MCLTYINTQIQRQQHCGSNTRSSPNKDTNTEATTLWIEHTTLSQQNTETQRTTLWIFNLTIGHILKQLGTY